MIVDIHTHHLPPQPDGVICIDNITVEIHLCNMFAEQLFSAGVHPWATDVNDIDKRMETVRKLAAMPQVVAVGETGIDTLKGAPMYVQLNLLKEHLLLSEQICKPLILHSVRGSDIIMGLHRDMAPQQKWCIHGFRGKEQEALMLAKKGIYLSFGEKFNASALKSMFENYPAQLLAETDTSPLSINQIIVALSATVSADLLPTIQANTADFLNIA